MNKCDESSPRYDSGAGVTNWRNRGGTPVNHHRAAGSDRPAAGRGQLHCVTVSPARPIAAGGEAPPRFPALEPPLAAADEPPLTVPRSRRVAFGAQLYMANQRRGQTGDASYSDRLPGETSFFVKSFRSSQLPSYFGIGIV